MSLPSVLNTLEVLAYLMQTTLFYEVIFQSLPWTHKLESAKGSFLQSQMWKIAKMSVI